MKSDNRKTAIHLTIFFVLLTLVWLNCERVTAAIKGISQPKRIILNLTENPAVSQAVTWRTDGEIRKPQAQITIAVGSPNLEDEALTMDAKTEIASTDNEETVYYHSAVFNSLKPNTMYAYRVGSLEGWSEWNHFKTASKDPDPFTFVYLGDPQNNIESMCSRVFREAFRKAPESAFWLFTGDTVNQGKNDNEWEEFYNALGWISRTTPMILLPGNHEYKKTLNTTSSLTHLWRPQFTLPQNGPAGLEESAYFIDYQGVRFVMLNGNERLEDQAKWLKNILSNNPQRWTVVSIHQPFYSTAKDRDNPLHRTLFTKLFDKYSVDLVLQGHDHTYGRTYKVRNGKREKKQGTVYVVSVSGPKQYQLSQLYQNLMAKTGTQLQLFQIIKVDINRLVYEAYTATGKLFDSFTLVKE